jgi:hypothetical protein
MFSEFLGLSMIFSSSHYVTVNRPFFHLLPEYRLQLNISMPPEDDPKFLACCVLSENTLSTGDEYTNNFKWSSK